jgi:GNAT superfamily N-acetyltransferase
MLKNPSAQRVGPPRIDRIGMAYESDFARLLLRLDDASRRCRFLANVNDSFLEQHARRAVTTTTFLAGAFVGLDLCGVAEVYEIDDRSVEAAFVVDATFRNLGFGTALLATALDWAYGAGRHSLRVAFLVGNVPMRRMAWRAGARIAAPDGEIEAVIGLAPRRAAVGPTIDHTATV